MVLYVNETGLISQILVAGSTTVTGSMEATFLVLFFVFIAISLLFQIPIEITFALLLPISLVFIAYTSTFYIILIPMIVLLSFILAKNFLWR